MHRDANGAALICDSAGNRLANPPRCIGTELETTSVLELVDRTHQTGVCLPGSDPGSSDLDCDTSWRSTQPSASCPRELLLLGALVFVEHLLNHGDTIPQARWRFLSGNQDLTILLQEFVALSSGDAVTSQAIDL